MTTLRYSASKIADHETVLPGFTKLWKQIKDDTRTRVRCPKSLWITDQPHRPCPDDSSLCRRYAVDLETMSILAGVSVSCGEWAIANHGTGVDQAIDQIPNSMAVITCEWNDYYRFFSITIQASQLIKSLENKNT